MRKFLAVGVFSFIVFSLARAQIHPPVFSENTDLDGTACTAGIDGRVYTIAYGAKAGQQRCCLDTNADGTLDKWQKCDPSGPAGNDFAVQMKYSNALADAGFDSDGTHFGPRANGQIVTSRMRVQS